MNSAAITALTPRAAELVQPGRRAILGICGAPGAGKSALAVKLVKRLNAAGVAAAHVPMDGFHLADVSLRERGLLEAKGAIETFDDYGYLALLRRLRVELDHDVLAPGFERDLEQPLAAAITVPAGTTLVVTEGNYLLDDSGAWPLVRAELDAVWFVDLDDNRRRSRLVARHIKFGKEPVAAQEWMDRVDEPNAQRILARQAFADLIVDGG